jgi:hypothetical protein
VSATEGRAYGPLTLTLGVGLVAMGLALSVQMIAAVVGPFDLLDAAPVGTPALGVWLPASAVDDGRTDALRRARAWRAALGPRVVVREGGSLAALSGQGVAALAVSDARRLSEAELAALAGYVRGGGSAIVTGPVAVRGSGGEWRGTAAMARLLGVRRVVPLPRTASLALAAATRGPLSAGLAPGQRLALVPEPGAPALDDAAAELRWAGDEAEAGLLAPGPRGASLRRELGAGRLVWLGAGPDLSAAGATTPGGDFARLAAAAFAWAAREPQAEVLPAAGDASSRAAPAGEAGPAPDLAAEMRRLGPHRHLLEVTNRGGAAARGRVVRIHVNARFERARVQRTVLQQDEPGFRLRPAAGQVDVRLPELAAGRSLAYTLDLDPGERTQAGG